MFKQLIVGLLVATYSSYSFACVKAVTPLKRGEAAPCTGFLFSPDKELEMRRKYLEYDLLLEQVSLHLQQKELFQKELQETEVIVRKEREKAELWRQRAEEITKQYTKLEDSRTFRDWLFLGSGVVLTVAAGWAVGQASK